MQKIIEATITGTRPLLMHSDKFADPLNPLTKEHKVLTGKRKKTDEDHEAIAKSEWLGGLYIDSKGPYLPGINVESALVGGGKLSKLGTQLKRSVEVMDDRCYLQYDGPKDAEGLWNAGYYDSRSVKVQSARLMRYRPIFRTWACKIRIAFDPDSINREQVLRCLEDAGQYVGVGDYRPKFGRFTVTSS
ncbi:MAG: hypothetical protein EA420_16425 [Candidatus Competibacteraceae bacterium]|nr:MAG: hypothetical protein EA420_16425 [Candidatus Competibacteraceae bacterium]